MPLPRTSYASRVEVVVQVACAAPAGKFDNDLEERIMANILGVHSTIRTFIYNRALYTETHERVCVSTPSS